jgi:4a-hydroxytetrahydrobiopterin dehydratase
LQKLNEDDIRNVLSKQTDWRLEDEKIVREWRFSDFAEAITFVNRVAALAEQAGHHPDIDIRYNIVRLSLITHAVGGITNLDADMAKLITLVMQP